jgi:hypothetical protein
VGLAGIGPQVTDALLSFRRVGQVLGRFVGQLHCFWAGLQEKAVALFVEWVRAQATPGLSCEVVQLAGRTPLIFCEIGADAGCENRETVRPSYGSELVSRAL